MSVTRNAQVLRTMRGTVNCTSRSTNLDNRMTCIEIISMHVTALPGSHLEYPLSTFTSIVTALLKAVT